MKNILVFILFASMICWMMFSPIYRHVLIVRQAALQQETDYLLEVGASGSYGYIDAAMIEQSRQRLADFGLNQDVIEYVVTADDGSEATNPSAPLPRGTGLLLTVRYPYEDLFQIDRLIGMSPIEENAKMSAFGVKMSEYVP